MDSLDQKLGVQKCFDLAGRIVPKITNPALISQLDPLLSEHIIQVIASN
jgi:hypothetical protein